MNTCKLCGKPLTLTPEYDYCMECQGRIMREATMPQNSFANNSTKLSMNIYDEAKQELIEIETYLEHSLEHIDKALERGKKVEELSKLKSELINAYHTLDLHKWGEITLTSLEHACWCKTRDDLINQIKLKEKESEGEKS